MSKYKLPKLPDARGRLFKRSHMLDGTIKVAYGPGQNAAMFGGGWPSGSDPNGPPTPQGEYSPPTDWPEAGRLLRLPQSVWLITDPDPYTGTDVIYVPSPGGDRSVPNPGTIELERLNAEFRAAKETIEALRPGRTYVETFLKERWDSTQLYSNIVREVTADGEANTTAFPAHYPTDGTGVEGCVRLPFMAIHAGFSWSTGTPDTGAQFTPYDSQAADNIPDGWYDDYEGFAYILCKTDLDYPPEEGGGPVPTDVPYYLTRQQAQNDFIDLIADRMSAWGRHHVEESASHLTSQWIVNRVAEHFKFNPSTGEDLDDDE